MADDVEVVPVLLLLPRKKWPTWPQFGVQDGNQNGEKIDAKIEASPCISKHNQDD